MSSNNGSNNHKPNHADALPQYVCIDEDEAIVVLDYLNAANADVDKELVLAHLALCFDCQDVAATMMRIDPRVRERVLALNAGVAPILVS